MPQPQPNDRPHTPSGGLRTGIPGYRLFALFLLLGLGMEPAVAVETGHAQSGAGLVALVIFFLALLAVTVEEFTSLRKSKPMLLATGAIWLLVGYTAAQHGETETAIQGVQRALGLYAELMLLVLVVMTYVNAMNERRIFRWFRSLLATWQLSYRELFWASGTCAFLLSPFLGNISISLLGGAILIAAVGKDRILIPPAFIHIVVAANAGGCFSPFGDITTLLVWQQSIEAIDGTIHLSDFFRLLPPALAAWLIPALLIQRSLPAGLPAYLPTPPWVPLRGAWQVVALFFISIGIAVLFRSYLDLPAAIGMLTGLSLLQFFGFYLKMTHPRNATDREPRTGEEELVNLQPGYAATPFDIFERIARVEWDILLFLCGVSLSVAGLAWFGYMSLASQQLYGTLGAEWTHIALGLMSAIIENTPAMYAMLNMMPELTVNQWLLATLATGVGGSILSIGSATGLVLMAQAPGLYTFFTHLRWSWTIMVGYACAVLLFLGLTH